MEKREPEEDKLNIGCGREKKDGFLNIDKSPQVNPDEVVNVEEGLPYPDNSFNYIFSSHALEHIRPQHWKFFLNEISRVAKHNAILELYLPFDNTFTRTNIDHYRTFDWTSFNQLEKNSEYNYYSDLVLERISRYPTKIERAFWYLFSFLKKEIHLKYRVIKEDE